MIDDLARIGERLRQNRAARQTEGDATRLPRQPVAGLFGGTFVAGDRVFDTVTGQEGDVTHATGFGSAPLGLVGVRLDGGAAVSRQPSDLVLRPALP